MRCSREKDWETVGKGGKGAGNASEKVEGDERGDEVVEG